jgi:hypothetical protein
MVFKASNVYVDGNGQGHCFSSTITGGLAGNGHNNIVTSTAEQTQKAMEISNNTKNMVKTVNSLTKDFKTLNQKP